MSLHPGWEDISLRLLLAVAASALIGLDRSARGHAANLRTTILVGLAAAVAMIQANILPPVGGKAHDSFAVTDPMRLPLGILTGVVVIGGSAALKCGELVTDVTTAATLRLTTVIGLCFGGGQIGLGIAATAIAILKLSALRWLDVRIPGEHRAMPVVRVDAATSPNSIIKLALQIGYQSRFRQQTQAKDASCNRLGYEGRWRRPEVSGPPVDLIKIVQDHYRITSFELTSETPS